MQAQIQLQAPIMDQETSLDTSRPAQQLPQKTLDQNILNQQDSKDKEKKIEQLQDNCVICCLAKPIPSFHKFCCQSHSFCKTCIIQLVNTHLYNYKILKCPESQCLAEFSQSSPYFNLLKPEDQKKLLKIRRNLQILRNPALKICKIDQCDGTLLIKPESIKCSLCNSRHCGKCFQIYHNGHCDSQVVIKLNNRYRYKKCPNCQAVVEKLKGCNHIVCLCGFQFCYKCGGDFKNAYLGHNCIVPFSYLDDLRDQIQTGDSYSKYINCPRILHKLQSNPEKGLAMKYLHICFVTLLIYPLLCLLSIVFFLGEILFVFLIFVTLYLVSSIVLPIAQIFTTHLMFGVLFNKLHIPGRIISILLFLILPITMVSMVLFMPLNPSLREGMQYVYHFFLRFVCIVRKIVTFIVFLPFLMCARKEFEPYE